MPVSRTLHPASADVAVFCRGSTSQAAVASRAAAVTQSFQLKPPSTKQPPTPARRPPSAGPSTPEAASAANSSTTHTNGLQLLPRVADTQQAESLPQGAKQALPRHASRETSQQQRVGQQKQQQQQQPQQPPPQQQFGQQQQQQQQQPGQLVGQQQLGGHAQSQAGSVQQRPAQQQSDTLNLHQSDVYSPLQASAPTQVVGLIKCHHVCSTVHVKLSQLVHSSCKADLAAMNIHRLRCGCLILWIWQSVVEMPHDIAQSWKAGIAMLHPAGWSYLHALAWD